MHKWSRSQFCENLISRDFDVDFLKTKNLFLFFNFHSISSLELSSLDTALTSVKARPHGGFSRLTRLKAGVGVPSRVQRASATSHDMTVTKHAAREQKKHSLT